MNFDIASIMDEGLSFVISILAVYAIYQFGKLVSKHIPAIMDAATKFIKAWDNFTDSMDDNVRAIERNTDATNEGCKQSSSVLQELVMFKTDWVSHDASVDEIRELTLELRRILVEEKYNDKILERLELIIAKLEKKESESNESKS